MRTLWPALCAGAMVCAPALMAANLKLGTMAEIQVDPQLRISVVVDMGQRSSREIAENFLANPRNASRLTRGRTMTIPFDELADPYKAIAVLRLFPEDRLTPDGVVHVVTLENETLARIAGIYTGSTRNSRSIRRAGTVGEVSVTRRHEILVTISKEGVDVDALGRAVLKDPRKIRGMVRGPNIVIPADEMKDAYRAAVLKHLFYNDTIREDALRHKVTLNIETLHRIALWFTGDANNWPRLKRASNKRSNEIAMRETIVIPRSLLGSWAAMTEDDIAAETGDFPLALTSRSRRGEIQEGQQLLIPKSLLPAWTRHMEGGEDGAQDAAKWYVYAGTTNGPLTYTADSEGGYASYRLRRGEALYSNVIVRFTGAVDASDVMQLAREVLQRSGYRNARRLPVNALIKIPMRLLSPDWRPEGDPTRAAEAAEETAVAQVEQQIREEQVEEPPRPRTRALDGITVILDAGHGGRDPGALGSGGLTENEVVYDIMCRIMRQLSRRTRAKVSVTIEDRRTKHNPSSAAVIQDNREEFLRTSPAYSNDNIVMSANLRWYLANSYVRQAIQGEGELDNVVFTSFHADALHPSVNGAMIYVPSARHCAGRYTASSSYNRYQEVRQRRTVSFSTNDRLRSQALSTRFAERLVSQLRSSRIALHGPKTIRGYIIRHRGGGEWVPAVIRYNAAPTKILIEIGNIKNSQDAANMRNPAWREKFATAYVDALIAQFGGS